MLQRLKDQSDLEKDQPRVMTIQLIQPPREGLKERTFELHPLTRKCPAALLQEPCRQFAPA